MVKQISRYQYRNTLVMLLNDGITILLVSYLVAVKNSQSIACTMLILPPQYESFVLLISTAFLDELVKILISSMRAILRNIRVLPGTLLVVVTTMRTSLASRSRTTVLVAS